MAASTREARTTTPVRGDRAAGEASLPRLPARPL